MGKFERHTNPNVPSPFQIERILAYRLKAELVKDEIEQNEDKDLRLPNGKTVSVKFQATAARTGNISLETLLEDTRTGDQTPGNFAQCKADFYIVVVPRENSTDLYDAYLWRKADLVALVKRNPDFRTSWLNQERVEANRALGRKFDQARSVLVPLDFAVRVAQGAKSFSYAAVKSDPAYREFARP